MFIHLFAQGLVLKRRLTAMLTNNDSRMSSPSVDLPPPWLLRFPINTWEHPVCCHSPPSPGISGTEVWGLATPMGKALVLPLRASSQSDDVGIGCFHGDGQRVPAFRVLSSQVSSPFQEQAGQSREESQV